MWATFQPRLSQPGLSGGPYRRQVLGRGGARERYVLVYIHLSSYKGLIQGLPGHPLADPGGFGGTKGPLSWAPKSLRWPPILCHRPRPARPGLLGARPAALPLPTRGPPPHARAPAPDDRRARTARRQQVCAREPVRVRERRERILRWERSGSVVKSHHSCPGTCEAQLVDRRYASCKRA